MFNNKRKVPNNNDNNNNNNNHNSNNKNNNDNNNNIDSNNKLTQKLFSFPLALIPIIHRIGNSPNILFLKSREQDESRHILLSIGSCLKSHFAKDYTFKDWKGWYTLKMPFMAKLVLFIPIS